MPVQIGERYRDRYEVIERIGEGAFAYVFRAREPAAGRDVALKVLKEPYRQVRDVVERFQREVFAVATINSPHVVSLLDFGFADDEFFIVMEFVRGMSLRQLMMAEPWAPEDALVVLGQIAHALAAAHKHQIVHRDLKPENVMLVENDGLWQAKVLDFGFAKLADLERTLDLEPITRVGFCFGTPQYLSPEQIRGFSVDGGADLFALGVIAYEMLVGRRPWDGADPRAVMTAVLRTLPPPALALHPSLRGRLEEVNAFLLRALEKERKQRPADAVAFFEELQTALFGGAAAARTALAGARPVTQMEDVTSRSIVLKPSPELAQRRFDATELDVDINAAHAIDDRSTTQFKTQRSSPNLRGSDTVRESALDSTKHIVDKPSDIPIFVASGVASSDARLPSQYLPRIDAIDMFEVAEGGDSVPSALALPLTTARVIKAAPSRWRIRALWTVLVLLLLALAFAAGRWGKF
ncbi:MAG TPA: serine/threonine-protein kinase [Polyangia bacterium]|nr:serine/threonine-protein kinase [Polyangia bacterium]